MHKEFFTKQIERLRGVYSSASLTEERVKVLWDKFQLVENTAFEKGISFLIGEYTTQALPPVSRFSEAMWMFRPKGGPAIAMQEMLPAHHCEACRDFGFGFHGDMVVSCICEAGVKIGPEEMVKHQINYDRGAKYMKSGAGAAAIFAELPYDPQKRIGEEFHVEEEG